MPTLIPTIGGTTSNSYETLAEAEVYFDERLPLPTPWVASGDSAIRALLWATKVLGMMAVPHKTLRQMGGQNYIYTSKYWTGSPASATQKLAWPRLGMLDANGNALDVAVSSIAVGSPTTVVTNVPHRRTAGDKVFFVDTASTPTLDGERTVVTVIDETSFTIAVNVTVAGAGGRMTWLPQELKDAQSELAGQLLISDTTLDNSTITGGITSVRAGSVSVTFKDFIAQHVLPDAVLNLMPQSWFYPDAVESAMQAMFGVVSERPVPRYPYESQ